MLGSYFLGSSALARIAVTYLRLAWIHEPCCVQRLDSEKVVSDRPARQNARLLYLPQTRQLLLLMDAVFHQYLAVCNETATLANAQRFTHPMDQAMMLPIALKAAVPGSHSYINTATCCHLICRSKQAFTSQEGCGGAFNEVQQPVSRC